MRQPRVKPETLTDEQIRFFIDTWENNSNSAATIILCDKLNLGMDSIFIIAKQLRQEGKLRNKITQRYSNKELSAFKDDFENGMTISEIAKNYHRDEKAVRKSIKIIFGGSIPKINKNTNIGETWKDIDGFDTHQVSDKGRIYVKATNQIIYGYRVQRYRYVNLPDESGKKHKYAVHRLVAQAFIPNPENKSEIDHIDSNPSNNDVTNLRWVDHEEQYNNEESRKKYLLGIERKQKRWKIKPLLEKIFEIEPDKMELIKMIIDYKD